MKFSCSTLILLIALTLLLPSRAHTTCQLLLNKDQREKIKVDNNSVSILYLPSGGHTKIRVGDKVYFLSGDFRKVKNHQYEALSRYARNNFGGEFFEFGLRVSQEEFETLQTYYSEENVVRMGCTKTACAGLAASTSAIFPRVPLVSSLPFLNASILLVSRFLPWSRVETVGFSGRFHRLPFSVFAAGITGGFELGGVSTLGVIGFFIVKYYYNGILNQLSIAIFK